VSKVAASSNRPIYEARVAAATGGVACADSDTGSDLEANGHFSHLKDLLALPGLVCLSLETDAVLQHDEHPDALFGIVSDGIVGIQHVLTDGRRSISHLFLPGDIIDFRYFNKVASNAVCLFPCELVLVDADSLSKLGEDEQEVRSMLGHSLMKHWGFATRHCTDLARKSAVEKLASYIFECQNRNPVRLENVNKGSVHLALRRIDISDYLGLRPETLCRAFAKLKQSKLIAFNDIGYVHILNEDVLRNIADGCSVDKHLNEQRAAS